MANEIKGSGTHNIVMENRKTLFITGILDANNFNEEKIVLDTDQGKLFIKGKNLHITKLSIETGEVSVSGQVDILEYTNKMQNTQKGVIAKIFK